MKKTQKRSHFELKVPEHLATRDQTPTSLADRTAAPRFLQACGIWIWWWRRWQICGGGSRGSAGGGGGANGGDGSGGNGDGGGVAAAVAVAAALPAATAGDGGSGGAAAAVAVAVAGGSGSVIVGLPGNIRITSVSTASIPVSMFFLSESSLFK